jgi:metal-dependent amidase/aminoacylase/carboxypeptidase family protein
VITHGGDAANVIPEYTSASILVRADNQEYLDELNEKFRNIVNAAALATGCEAKITEGLTYQQRVCNTKLVETFGANLAALGFDHDQPPTRGGVGSSDIGNVSQRVPTIHPYLQICEPGIGGHTEEFAEASKSERANQLTADGSIMLAWTAADVLLRPELREELRSTFRDELGRDPA